MVTDCTVLEYTIEKYKTASTYPSVHRIQDNNNMPLVKKLNLSGKTNPNNKMKEVDCEYLFVGNDLQIDTFSTTDGAAAQTIRFTPEAQKQLIEIIKNKFVK